MITKEKFLNHEFSINIKKILYLLLTHYLSYTIALIVLLISSKTYLISIESFSLFHFLRLYQFLVFFIFCWYGNFTHLYLGFYWLLMLLYISTKKINNIILLFFFIHNFIFTVLITPKI